MAIDTPYRVPETFVELANAWALRDDLYARLSKPLDDAQIAAVKERRKRETWCLPPEQRAFAWAQVHTWYPPECGQ